MSAARPAESVTFVNADLGGGHLSSLRLRGNRIAAVGAAPADSDQVLDLAGDRVLPGLINAHDHLQLNSYPPLDYAARYSSATEWIGDFNARLRGEPAVRAGTAVPRVDRPLAGGIKNLLSGVTTVAHHDPLEPLLLEADFPTAVLRDFGWSHSLFVDGAERVRISCVNTPAGQPWIVHAGEGTDKDAYEEFEQLESLGCLRSNTVLVHALALDAVQRQRLAAAGAGMVWCPSSNQRLFGRTAAVGDLIAAGRVALGTDSRLTGAADLLAELKVAGTALSLDDATLERLVTCDAARLLRLPDRGVLSAGARADLVVLPGGMPLSAVTRADLRLAMIDGTVRYGDADCVCQLAPKADFGALQVDGRDKLLVRHLVTALADGRVNEPGVSVPRTQARVACA